jgi:hypothetical protein
MPTNGGGVSLTNNNPTHLSVGKFKQVKQQDSHANTPSDFGVVLL